MHATHATVPAVDLWERFTAKAIAVGCTVHQVRRSGDVPAVLSAVGSLGQPRFTTSLAKRWPELAVSPHRPAERNTPAPDVLAAPQFGIAETGSLLVRESNVDRGACFLAERLWLVVGRADIRQSLDEALAEVQALIADGQPYLTLMTGPSRTADIERTLTIGVHGPRNLAVVLVEEG